MTQKIIDVQELYNEIKSVLLSSRAKAYSAVSSAMVTAYWSIGKLIVEHEQNGDVRAEYGKSVLNGLAERLTADFGKGFDYRNLAYMRKFYLSFPNVNALRSELTWTHYRSLLRVENESARLRYIKQMQANTNYICRARRNCEPKSSAKKRGFISITK